MTGVGISDVGIAVLFVTANAMNWEMLIQTLVMTTLIITAWQTQTLNSMVQAGRFALVVILVTITLR
jgi:hypothetical protein